MKTAFGLVGLLLSLPAWGQVVCEVTERNGEGLTEEYPIALEVAPNLGHASSTEKIAPTRLFPGLRLDLFAFTGDADRVTVSANVVDTESYAVQGSTGTDGSASVTLLEMERVVQVSCAVTS